MSKKKLVIIVSAIILVSVVACLLMDFDNDGLSNAQELLNYNPVVEYAQSKNLPNKIVEKLRPLGTDNMDEYERGTIDELSQLGQDSSAPLVNTSIDSIIEDGWVDYNEYKFIVLDWDGDYVRNDLDPNPLEIDADGGGMDDFNEIYTYPHYAMDPNNPEDDVEFIERIPNVTARHWELDDIVGGYTFYNYVEISERDPLIAYLAERFEIIWEKNSEGQNVGTLYVDGLLIWKGVPEPDNSSIDQPSDYFTHGRKSTCGTSSLTDYTILSMNGYSVVNVGGRTPNWRTDDPNDTVGHGWTEVNINGTYYVVNFNNISPREGFYENNGWTIGSYDYDPDWYKN